MLGGCCIEAAQQMRQDGDQSAVQTGNRARARGLCCAAGAGRPDLQQSGGGGQVSINMFMGSGI